MSTFYEVLQDSLIRKRIKVTYEDQHTTTGIVKGVGYCDNGRFDLYFNDSSKDLYNLPLITKIEFLD